MYWGFVKSPVMDKAEGGRRDGSDVGSNFIQSRILFFISIFGLKMALHVFIETEGKFAFDI